MCCSVQDNMHCCPSTYPKCLFLFSSLTIIRQPNLTFIWEPTINTTSSESWASLVAQLVKNPPAVRVAWVLSLGWEDAWRKERLPTPVFLPGEVHGLYSPWNHKELDMTERLSLLKATQIICSFCKPCTSPLSISVHLTRSICVFVAYEHVLSFHLDVSKLCVLFFRTTRMGKVDG